MNETDIQTFAQYFPTPSHVYNSVKFNLLNSHKVRAIHPLLFSDKKVRMGILLGEDDKLLKSPFSAPYGGFCSNGKQCLEMMEKATELLRQYSLQRGKRCRITLPPLAYDMSQGAKWANVLGRKCVESHMDLNYHMPLCNDTPYESLISSTARNKLKQATRHPFQLTRLDSNLSAEVARAYAIIKRNRDEHNYPLRMSLDNVLQTTRIIKADFFVLSVYGEDVAAAQVFHVAEGIAQVIYWGDLKEHSHLRTMNILAAMLYRHYTHQGLRMLDIGPSCEDGLPNYGLCSFKEDVGCQVSPKYTFMI